MAYSSWVPYVLHPFLSDTLSADVFPQVEVDPRNPIRQALAALGSIVGGLVPSQDSWDDVRKRPLSLMFRVRRMMLSVFMSMIALHTVAAVVTAVAAAAAPAAAN